MKCTTYKRTIDRKLAIYEVSQMRIIKGTQSQVLVQGTYIQGIFLQILIKDIRYVCKTLHNARI
jgi:hypothetical protein